MKCIPIFLIVHNQLESLKKSVASYKKYIETPINIIYHNVASTYEPTLAYLKEKETQGSIVYHTKENNHHTVMDSVKDYISKHKTCEYCIITDPDIELYNVRGDILEVYVHALNETKSISVGPMLKIDDIPEYYPKKNWAIRSHSIQFWNKPRQQLLFKENIFEYINCLTDTTFQLFSVKNIPKTFPYNDAIRFLHPYSARHLDWYIDPNNLTPCQKYYRNNTTMISHWNNNKWKGEGLIL